MIDWQKVAEQNGLSVKEFESEIYTIAACIAANSIDKQKGGDAIKFTCSDDVSKLEMIIKRVE